MTTPRHKSDPPVDTTGHPDHRESVGRVYLVGAGPGDPKLITVAGLEAIRRADVVVFDALANRELLAEARSDADLIDAGKRAKHHKLSQDEINALLADHARAGRTVTRLKGGDPYVFGRGSEEAIYLYERGVETIVIPGLPAATAGLAYAGIPVTHRGLAVTCTLITGHEDPTKPESQIDLAPLADLAKRDGTLCFYMAMGRLPIIAEQLQALGLSGQTPAACVQWATLPQQRRVTATLATLPDAVDQAGLGAPAIVVIGPVAAVHDEALRWFERRPLFGRTIAITRTRRQASELGGQLRELGAAVIEAPTIAIDPAPDRHAALDAVRKISDHDWLVLTSANAVTELARLLDDLNRDSRYLAPVKIATVGKATTEALWTTLGLRADLVPARYTSDALADELIAADAVAGRRFLLLRAEVARQRLVDRIDEAGGCARDVPLYRTRIADELPDELLDALRAGAVDWITFTSGSTARNFMQLLGDRRDLLGDVRLASIGPVTSNACREHDLEPTVEAEQHDIPGLIAAICRHERMADNATAHPPGDRADVAPSAPE